MKQLYSIVLVLGGTALLIGALLWIAKPSGSTIAKTASSSPPSSLVAKEDSYDFGTISMAKGVVTRDFAVNNTATTPIRLTKLYTSCMCTRATLIHNGKKTGPFGMPGHITVPGIDETIQPGETVTVEAAFDPAAHGPSGVGPIARKVFLENDSGGPLELNFKAVVTP